MAQKNKILLVSAIVFLLICGLLLFIFARNKGGKKSTSSSTDKSYEVLPTPILDAKRNTKDLPIIKRDKKTGKEIIEIPYDYVVKSVSGNQIVLQKPGGGERDIITYPKKLFNVIKVFELLSNGLTNTASLSNISVGQNIRVKNINRGEEIQFFIVK